MDEISAGGVVIHDDKVLVLRKFRGDWVLPKGRLEVGETREQAALREVKEETGVQTQIVRYVGFVKYLYRHHDGEKVRKTVYYYLMSAEKVDVRPQREEGFCEAALMDEDRALELLKHDAERNMVQRAFRFYEAM